MGFYSEAVGRYGSKAAAARALGLATTTLKDRLVREAIGGCAVLRVVSDTHEATVPEAMECRPSIDEILARMESDYETKLAASDSSEWFEITVRDSKPFGLMIWGDPHIDNPGCDITRLRHHMALARHPAVFSINIGDTLDGWVGRLTRLYADSRIDVHTARELAAWFMREVRWLLWLAGNHDMWADNEALLRQMSKQAGVRLLPWQAKFKLAFPNGNTIRVHAAHDFPGRSMHNIVHGNMRAARFSSPADLLLSGHLHDWGMSQFEMAGFDRCPLSIRVRGYKTMDGYAMTGGFQQSHHGSSCLIVIDPNVEGPGRMSTFWDIAQGVDILDALCKRYDSGSAKPRSPSLQLRASAGSPAGSEQAVRAAGKKGARSKPRVPRDAKVARSPARGKGRRSAGRARKVA